MLVTTDLHLTNNAADEYRWRLFPWLNSHLRDGETLLILGDLTDKKDYHASALVNRVVDTLMACTAKRIVILKGNHDYIEENEPFFRFLNHTRKIQFVVEPTWATFEGHAVLLLPHTKRPQEDWDSIGVDADMICCHQTYDGAEAGNGYRLTNGLSRRYWSRKHRFTGPVLSGDIHTPQELGDVTYVGTPYPVAFGDHHTPRVLRVDQAGKRSEIRVPSIKRLAPVIELPAGARRSDVRSAVAGLALDRGDQVKATVVLDRADFHAWGLLRDQFIESFERQGVSIHGLTMREAAPRATAGAAARSTFQPTRTAAQALRAFCDQRGLSGEERSVGEDYLEP